MKAIVFGGTDERGRQTKHLLNVDAIEYVELTEDDIRVYMSSGNSSRFFGGKDKLFELIKREMQQ